MIYFSESIRFFRCTDIMLSPMTMVISFSVSLDYVEINDSILGFIVINDKCTASIRDRLYQDFLDFLHVIKIPCELQNSKQLHTRLSHSLTPILIIKFCYKIYSLCKNNAISKKNSFYSKF